MPETVFEPHNDLEHDLVRAREGRMDEREFMERLMGAHVFLPVRDENIDGFQASDEGAPLTLESKDGTSMVVLFSSAERAREFLAQCAGCDGGLLVEFDWVLERTGAGYGIALNPGWEVGLDLEPGLVDDLLKR